MFHSNKKKEKQVLTEEDQKKIEDKLEKIKAIQSRILKMKHDKETDIKNLDILLKAGILMPDFSTMWCYRKELIIFHKTQIAQEDFYKFLLKELENISGIMMKNPKSYVLWHHRIWVVSCLSEIEIQKENSKQLKESSLFKEILLCNKFFERDERNFHVWNYRITLLKEIYKFFPKVFFDFLSEELSFTLKMIKKSFSNFSAWHYRSKLITLDLPNKKLNWSNKKILDYFQEDLFYLKNAIFTDPRDQSPWNYHNWIIGNLTPIFLKNKLNFNGLSFNLNFSEKIPFEKFLYSKIEVIDDNNSENNFENFDLISFINKQSKTENISLSNFYNENFTFDLTGFFNDNDKGKLYKISLRKKPEENLNLNSNLKFNNDFIPLKNNLDFPVIEIIFDKNGIKEIKNFYENKNEENSYAHLQEFLNTQLEMLNELIKVTEEYIENAHFRKLEILMLQNYLGFNKENKPLIESERNLLISKSKRMKEVYKNINYEFIY